MLDQVLAQMTMGQVLDLEYE
jgi:hypothetical protein